MTNVISSNASVAAKLDELAKLLEDQGANSFRVAAYQACCCHDPRVG